MAWLIGKPFFFGGANFNKQILGQLRENLDCVKIVVAKEDLPLLLKELMNHKKNLSIENLPFATVGDEQSRVAEFIIQQRLNVLCPFSRTK